MASEMHRASYLNAAKQAWPKRVFMALVLFFVTALLNPYRQQSPELYFVMMACDGTFAAGAGGSAPLYLALYFAPTLFFCYLFSSYFSADLGAASTYIFTRMGNKRQWALKKIINVFLASLAYVVMSFILLTVISICSFSQDSLGTMVFNDGFVRLVTEAAVLHWLVLVLLVLVVNLISLYTNEVASYVMVVSAYLVTLLCCSLSVGREGSIVGWLPWCRGVVPWNCDLSAYLPGPMQEDVLLNSAVSYLYLLIVLAVVSLLLVRRTEKYDFLGRR